jgi:hypothetical protein
MNIRNLIRMVGFEYEDIWTDDPQGRLRERCDELLLWIRRRQWRLIRLQRMIMGLRSRIETNERRARDLGEQVKTSADVNAYCSELMRISIRADRDRLRLRRYEDSYEIQLAKLSRARQRFAGVRESLWTA